MFPSSSSTSNKTPSPSSSPPKRAVKGVQNFVKGVKRRISLLGHHRRHSSGATSNHSDNTSDADSAHAPPQLTHHDQRDSRPDHSPFSPLIIPLPPSPSSSRTRAQLSDASSQLSASYSDSHTYASAEDSTLLSVNLSHLKEHSEVVEQVPLLSPVQESPVMGVRSSPSPEAAADKLPRGELEMQREDEVESDGAEDSSASAEDSQKVEERLAAPPVLEESDVPDPFLVDDPEDPASEEEEQQHRSASYSTGDDDETDSPPADEIALAQSIVEPPPTLTPTSALTSTEAHPLASPVLQTNKPVPPAPAEEVAVPASDASSSSEEDEPPTLYISGLTVPTMFLPIPNTDALSTLLAKYIPPEQRPRRDVAGDWQRSDYHTLVMTNSWRALARMARDRIVATDPGDVALLLNLWYVRLSSLARLRLYAQTNHEMANLFSVLAAPPAPIVPSSPSHTLPTQPSTSSTLTASTTGSSLSSYPSLSSLSLPQTQHRSTLTQVEYEYLWENLMPFELEVLKAKSRYWEGDHMGYLDELTGMLTRCKRMAKKGCRGGGKGKGKGGVRDDQAVGMWKERGARICLIMVSQLIEMKDFSAATSLLSSLLSPTSATSSPRVRAALGRIHLQSGNILAASEQFSQIAQDPTAPRSLKAINSALLGAAEGDWDKAAAALREIVDESADGKVNEGIEEKERYIAANNLAVTMLAQGQLKEGIQLLETTLKSSPSTVVSAEPILFNLSTLYELRANVVSEKKRELLVEVAKWAGDGLRTTCLKMPAT